MNMSFHPEKALLQNQNQPEIKRIQEQEKKKSKKEKGYISYNIFIN